MTEVGGEGGDGGFGEAIGFGADPVPGAAELEDESGDFVFGGRFYFSKRGFGLAVGVGEFGQGDRLQLEPPG
ncbi:MAG: hypothetical protein AAF710_07225 [Planctomycetota bacterium]